MRSVKEKDECNELVPGEEEKSYSLSVYMKRILILNAIIVNNNYLTDISESCITSPSQFHILVCLLLGSLLIGMVDP